MNISNFKRGQFITRTQGSIGREDYSFIGERMTLLGIANGCIYLQDEEIERTEPLELQFFSDGWEIYVDVDQLAFDQLGVEQNEDKDFMDDFKAYVKKLHESENYEVLTELRNLFDNVLKAK